MDADNIIRRGSKRQILACFLICFTITSSPFEHTIVNFLTPYVDYWCNIEEISHCPENTQKYVISQSTISYENFDYCFTTKENWTLFSSCKVPYNIDYGNYESSVHQCSTGFKFYLNGRKSTVTSRFSLVCDKLWLLEIISPLYTVSMTVGSLVSGLADIFGRKTFLMISIALHAVGGVMASLANNIYLFIFGRMLIALALRGIGISCLILMIEIFPSKKIQLGCWLGALSHCLGNSIAILISYVIRDYKWLQLAVSLPFCFIILCWNVIPESPTWLISKNRTSEAVIELKKFANSGGYMDEIESILNSFPLLETRKEISTTKLTLFDLFKCKKLFYRTIMLCMIMSTGFLTMIGVSFNMGLIHGDIYLNQLISGLFEFVLISFFGIFILKFKRKTCLLIVLSLFLTCHIVSLTFTFLTNFDFVITITTLAAKILSIFTLMIGNIFTGELFPTEIRQQASGFIYAVTGIASMIAPIIGGKLRLVWSPAPYIVYVCMSLLSVIFASFLPETMGCPLPQNIDEALTNRQQWDESSEDKQ